MAESAKEASPREQGHPHLLNAFSVNMINPAWPGVMIDLIEVEAEKAKAMLADGFVNAVGHEATAEVLTQRLGMPIAANRVNVALIGGDYGIIAQVGLPRLAEGQVLTAAEVAEAPIRYVRFAIVANLP